MTSRQKNRIYRLCISVLFAGFGIWALADTEYLIGAFWVGASIAWLLTVAFNWPRPHDPHSRAFENRG